MTDSNFCRLCASDEGVFLDIFSATQRQLGNRSFLKEFETCLSVKVNRDEVLSPKLCHRCVIELGHCNEFVEKHRRVYEAALKPKISASKKSCCLCLSTGKKNYLFNLAKDFRSTVDPLQKIYECFKEQITREEAELYSICLLCRYHLDLLYDLRKLAQEAKLKLQGIATSKVILASLPKTQTFVVNRKTTVIYQSEIEVQTLSDSESKCSTMARRQSRSKKNNKVVSPAAELKFRICGQCNSSIESGIDMYRLHTAGITVCKMCWITMDPFNSNRANKRKRDNQADDKNTRLCAVFLKDVLSSAASKDNGSYKVEKDKKGNTVYLVTDDSSENEEKSDAKLKRNHRNKHAGKTDESNGESGTNTRLQTKRSFNHEEGNGDCSSSKKLKSIKSEALTASSDLRRSTRHQSSDSDSTITKSKQRKVKGVKNDGASKTKNLQKLNNTQCADMPGKIKPNKSEGKAKGVSAETIKSKSEDSSSSGNGGDGRKVRKVRNNVPLILKPNLPKSPEAQKSAKRVEPRTTPALRESPAILKISKDQSVAKSQPSKTKYTPKKSKTLMMVSFPFKLKDPYECKVCRTKYKNKVIGMKHELTHYKQVEIKIEKLNITHPFQTNNENSTTELPEASSSISLPSSNKKSPQPEVPTSTSPPESEQDQGKGPESDTEQRQSVERSRRSESKQRDDKSPNIDDAKETDVVSSSNGPLAEESTLVDNESKTEAIEDISLELDPSETGDELKKSDILSAEADSPTESNIIDGNGTEKVSNETVEDDKGEELFEEVVDKAVSDIGDKTKEDKNDENDVLPSSNTTTGKDAERNRDSGEDIESDTDIRIVDPGSSAEDSNEQTEKLQEDTKTVNNISEQKETGDKVLDATEESEPSDEKKESIEASNKVLEDDITLKATTDDDFVARRKSDDVSSGEEQEIQKEEGMAFELGEPTKKIETNVRLPSVVTEILQEVIDLATAEVQKRVESAVTPVDETLENISKEINNTEERFAAADEAKTLSSINDVDANEVTESHKLDSNAAAENTLKNNKGDISATET